MSGSFYNAGNSCSCELVNEAELRDLHRKHARHTQGLWHGPVPLSEWNEQFLPEANVASPEIDLAPVSIEKGPAAFVRTYILSPLETRLIQRHV